MISRQFRLGGDLKDNIKSLIKDKITSLLSTLDENVPESIERKIIRIHTDFTNLVRAKQFTSKQGFGLLESLDEVQHEIEALPPSEQPISFRKKSTRSKPKKRLVVKKGGKR